MHEMLSSKTEKSHITPNITFNFSLINHSFPLKDNENVVIICWFLCTEIFLFIP